MTGPVSGPPSPFPVRIKIGPLVYRVSLVRDMDDLLGSTDHEKGSICLEAGQNIRGLAATLLHEILHGVWHVAGESELHENEAVVDRTANLLLAALLDSPHLLEYLLAVRRCDGGGKRRNRRRQVDGK